MCDLIIFFKSEFEIFSMQIQLVFVIQSDKNQDQIKRIALSLLFHFHSFTKDLVWSFANRKSLHFSPSSLTDFCSFLNSIKSTSDLLSSLRLAVGNVIAPFHKISQISSSSSSKSLVFLFKPCDSIDSRSLIDSMLPTSLSNDFKAVNASLFWIDLENSTYSNPNLYFALLNSRLSCYNGGLVPSRNILSPFKDFEWCDKKTSTGGFDLHLISGIFK